jgi:NAD(P)-dependent dehydrogenase (short-subunit alcohol dehydrogenase family)
MDAGLTNHRVLVTAGAAGIGLATAKAFLREGARVHVCDIDAQALSRVARDLPGATASVCDVADPAAVGRLFDEALSKLGGLDTLVNNAGIAGPTAPCESVALDDWRRTLDVNLTGSFLCAQRAIPPLRESRNASIANLSSAAGRFGFPLRTPYAASKWAIVGFTKSLAIELGEAGIRVNAILPGAVAGDRIDRVIDAKAKQASISFDAMRDRFLEKTSLRRFVTADDIANAIVFLASPLGANISGHALPVDGDAQSLA